MTHRWKILALIILFGSTGLIRETDSAKAQEADIPWVSKVISVQGDVTVKRHGKTDWQTRRSPVCRRPCSRRRQQPGRNRIAQRRRIAT